MSSLKITPDQIKLGYAIKLPSGWLKHPFLSSSLTIENLQQIQIIQSLGLSYVYFFPEMSKKIAPSSLPEVVDDISYNSQISEAQAKMQLDKMRRIEQAKTHRRDLQKTEKTFQHSLNQVKSLMKLLSSRPLNAINEADQLVSMLTDTIVNSQCLVLHLMSDNNTVQDGLHYHALNVSVLSMMLAKNLGLSAENIKISGIGALFHDVGKLKIPSQILRKTTTLTPPEANLLKLHTRFGTELVSLADNFPLEAWVILEQHHEHLDGSGYPKGLSHQQIHPLARLVAVVNTFDNLCYPTDGSKIRSPHHALSHLYRTMKGKLGEQEMKMLIRMMGVYPPGTIVMLSDNRVAMVMSVNSDQLLLPNVMIYDPEVPRLEAPIITLEADKLMISKVILPSALPQRVIEYLNPRAQVSYYVQGNS